MPVLTIPYNHNPQSISGPLSLTSYNLYNVGALGVGTGLPAWGVDVEGSGLDSEINAAGGYLVNGAAGSSGQCLASNGTVFNTPVSCITSLPALYYQTVYSNGTPLTQEPVLNVLPPLTAATVSGQTTLGITTTGSESKVVTAAAAGVSGNCPQWDAAGGLSDTGAPCGNAFTGTSGYQTLPGGLILEWGETTNFDTGPTTVTLPLPFPHACLMPAQLTNNSDISTTTREWESGSCTTTNFVARNDGSGQAHYFVIGW